MFDCNKLFLFIRICLAINLPSDISDFFIDLDDEDLYECILDVLDDLNNNMEVNLYED